MDLFAVFSFAFFAFGIGLISWYKTRSVKLNTTASLFLANRSNGYMVIGGSLFLTNISANQFIGENESVYINNMTVIGWGVSSVLAMLIVSEFFIPVYLKSGITTTPDFLEERYDRSTKSLVSVVFLLSYIVNLLPPALYGGAVAFNGMFNISGYFNISYWQSIWIIVWASGSLGCLYTVLGGLKAITISDSVLSVCMLVIGLLLPYFGLKYLGGGDISAGLTTLLSAKKEHLNAIGSAADAVPFSTLFTGMLIVNLYYWGMEQYIVQQTISGKSLADSQKGLAIGCIAKLLCPLLINIPGLIAVHLYPSLNNTAEVFPLLVRDVLPSVLTGLTVTIVAGAAITTYTAGLNSCSTLFILNLYGPWKEKRGQSLNEGQLVRAGKLFEVVVSIIAMISAPFIMFARGGFYSYLQQVSGMFSIPIFTIIFIGFVTRRVPAVAAKAGLVLFIVMYAFSQFVFKVDLHFLHVLAILFLLTSAFMLVLGRIYPMKTSYRQVDRSFVSLKPWKNRHFASVVLLILMVLMFVVFSPLGIAD